MRETRKQTILIFIEILRGIKETKTCWIEELTKIRLIEFTIFLIKEVDNLESNN